MAFHIKKLPCSCLLFFAKDCERQYAPLLAPGLGFRCATCAVDKVQGKIYSWRSVCSKPSDEVLDHCSAAWAETCSCGQLKPPPPTATFLSSSQQRRGGDTVAPEKDLLRPHARIPVNKAIQHEDISLPSDENLASSLLANSPDAIPQDSFFGFFNGNSYQAQDSPDVDRGGDSAF